MQKKAVVLFSGGLDSTTCLAIAKEQGFAIYALSFQYGQKHSVELEHAKRIAKQAGVKEHRVLTLPIGEWGGSSLTQSDLQVPDFEGTSDIPNTYVPARNTIFLSCALGFAETVGAYDIFIGANAVDYSQYPDCRPDYLAAFANMANLATKAGRNGERLQIHSPLLTLTKAEIIQLGTKLGVDYSQTISCYRADENSISCGECDSCVYRRKGFMDAGMVDPTVYRDI